MRRGIQELTAVRGQLEVAQKRLIDLRNGGFDGFSYMEKQSAIDLVQKSIDRLTKKISNVNFEISQLGVAATAFEMSDVDTDIKIVMIDEVSREDLKVMFEKLLQEIQDMKGKRHMTKKEGHC